MKKLHWSCTECDDVFETDSREHHVLVSCDCGEAWVDHEEYMLRASVAAEQLDAQFEEYEK